MPYIAVTKPNQGDVTRKELIDAIIDNLAYFNSIISGLTSLAVPNGSFELFTNNGSQDMPDEWVATPSGNGGSFILTGHGRADTECRHGRVAVKMTSPGGAGNGGYILDQSDFMEVSPLRPLFIAFAHKSSVATIRNKVQVVWYTAAQTTISTTDLYSSVNNPTSWQHITAWALPPATARYMKLRIVGAENTTTVAGSAYYDDVQVHSPEWRHEITIDTGGNYVWTAPSDATYVAVLCIGAGGGGAFGNGQGGGGGASGALCFGVLNVTAGTDYTFSVGTGGTGGTGAPNAGTGGTTTFQTLSATGGGGGGSGGTGNQAPGAASGGYVNTAGGNGGNGVGSTGGYGGFLAEIGIRPARSTTGVAGVPGSRVKWGTGGGGGGNGALGGAGADGMVMIFIA